MNGKEHKYYLGTHERGECYITWSIKDGKFSMCAERWLPSKRDIEEGGQCVDRIASYFPNDAKAQRMVAVWNRWHLNDMRAACEHQRAAGWEDQAAEQINTYKWRTKPEADKARRAAKDAAEAALKAGQTFTPTPEQVAAVNRESYIETQGDTLPPELAAYYEPSTDSTGSGYFAHIKTERRGWVRFDKDSRGLLCKPCSVCGYKYGSAWLKEELPAEVIAEIEAWSAQP